MVIEDLSFIILEKERNFEQEESAQYERCTAQRGADGGNRARKMEVHGETREIHENDFTDRKRRNGEWAQTVSKVRTDTCY